MEEATDPQLIGGDKEERDTFRDTSVRYLGFASELGESFKNIIGKTFYKASYGVAISYVAADAIEKGWKERQRRLEGPSRTSNQPRNVDSDRAVENLNTRNGKSDTRVANMETSETAASPSLGKGRKADPEAGGADTWPPVAAALDSLMWHGLATVAIPGVTINRAVKYATQLMDRLENRRLEKVTTGKSKPVSPRAPMALKRWVPAAVGLALIPLIAHPADQSMDYLMDVAVRPYLGTQKHRE